MKCDERIFVAGDAYRICGGEILVKITLRDTDGDEYQLQQCDSCKTLHAV